MRRFILAIVIASAAIWTGCQKEESGIITGVVTDAGTGEPISNANVKLNPRGETTLTGSDGTFQFNEIPDGTYSLSISKTGYVDLDDDYVINLTKGQTIKRDVQLSNAFESFKVCINGVEVDMIDFGTNINSINVSVVNNGSIDITDWIWIDESSDWIYCPIGYISASEENPITPNTGRNFSIEVKRYNLNIGEQTSYISVSSQSLTKQLLIKATGVEK